MMAPKQSRTLTSARSRMRSQSMSLAAEVNLSASSRGVPGRRGRAVCVTNVRTYVRRTRPLFCFEAYETTLREILPFAVVCKRAHRGRSDSQDFGTNDCFDPLDPLLASHPSPLAERFPY